MLHHPRRQLLGNLYFRHFLVDLRNLRSEVFANLFLPLGDCLKPLFDPMSPFLLCLAYPCLCLLQLQNPNLQPFDRVRINGLRRLRSGLGQLRAERFDKGLLQLFVHLKGELQGVLFHLFVF